MSNGRHDHEGRRKPGRNRRLYDHEITTRQDFPYAYSYAGAFPDVEIEAEQLPPHALRDIVFSTVKSFKGLERDVVIFCDVDGDFLADKPGEAYTAVSRAQHMLFVVHHESWQPPAV